MTEEDYEAKESAAYMQFCQGEISRDEYEVYVLSLDEIMMENG